MTMQKRLAFKEIQQLAVEASTVLGERRAAMIAGCHPTTLRSWIHRARIQLLATTIRDSLPRLRNWHRWIAGYVEAQGEIRSLEFDLQRSTADLAAELRERVLIASSRFSLDYIAQGCEVSDRILRHWLLGRVTIAHRLNLLRSLGHMRHMDAWPPPPGVRLPSEAQILVPVSTSK
jgi:hypothetical protein